MCSDGMAQFFPPDPEFAEVLSAKMTSSYLSSNLSLTSPDLSMLTR